VSNARKPAAGNRYRRGYLRSVPWFRRRDRWFTEQLARTGELRCVVCWQVANRRDLELHHLDYAQTSRIGSGWVAGEQHEQLCAMHSGCHELVHRVLDTDPVLRRHRTRPIATLQAIHLARTRLTTAEEAER
jgi:hypothetical protein